MIRDSYPFTGIDPVPYSRRVRAQGLSAQFSRAQATSGKRQAASFFMLDNKPYIWDKVITINQRIKYANSKRIRRKIYRAWQQAQSFGSKAQAATQQHQLVSSGAAGAGRPDATSHRRRGGRRAGYTNQLARSPKLRDLHAADPVPDGRRASSGGWRNGYHYSDQGTKIHGSQEVQGQRQSIQITDRGLRAPTPHQKSYPQARAKIKSYPQGTGTSSGTSWDSSSAQGTGRVGPQARKPSVTSSRIAEPGKSIGSL